MFSYPNLGAMVLVGFFNGDQRYPFFYGAIMGGEDAKKVYDHVRSNLSPDTIKKGKDAFIHTISVNNSKIDVYEAGDIKIDVLGDATNDNCKIDIDGKGNITISTTKKVQVNSPNIALESSGVTTIDSANISIKATNNLVLEGRNVIETGRSGIKITAPSVNLKATVLGNFDGPKHSVTFN